MQRTSARFYTEVKTASAADFLLICLLCNRAHLLVASFPKTFQDTFVTELAQPKIGSQTISKQIVPIAKSPYMEKVLRKK